MGLLDFEGATPEENTLMQLSLLSSAFQSLSDLGAGRPQQNPMQGILGMHADMKKRRAQQNIMSALNPTAPQFMVNGTPYGTRAEAAEAQKRAMGYKVADKRFTDPHEAFRYKETMYRQAPTDSNPDIPVMEDMPDIEERTTPYDSRQALIQAMITNPDAGYQDVALKAMLEQQKADKTAEMKNWEYGMSLPEEQRQQFFARAGSGSSPSAVQEWEFFNRLDPQQQARYLEMKRNPQIMNLGGTQAVRAPGGGVAESYTVTPKITDMPNFQAAQETAKATAKATVEAGVDSTKKGKTADSLLSNITQAETILNSGDASGSLAGKALSAVKGGVGYSDATTQANRQLKLISGWMVSNVPRMEGPQSNFDVQNYKEMAATVGDESIPVNDRLAALKQLRVLQNKYKQVQQGGTLNRGEILNVELQDALARGDTQNADLIRQEMSRMGVKEATKQQPKPQKAQSFDLPPNAKPYEGKILRDTKSGKRFKSVGGKWQEVK